jgi:transitional endoplasmic reticulum ATPase
MPIRRRSRSSRMPNEIEPIVQLWLLRLLVSLGRHRDFISVHGFMNDPLAETI